MRVTASVLNVRTGPGERFRVLGQLRKGDLVAAEEESEGWWWVEPPGGWVSGDFLEFSKAPLVPVGLNQILTLFGAPGSPRCSAGKVVLPESLTIGWKPESRISRFSCHEALEEQFTRVFHRIHSEGFWKDLKTFDGAYNDRTIKGSSKTSTHAWGIAIDLNASENGLGKDGTMSKDVVRIFEEEGFVWGGRFSRKDPMHFQYATSY